MGEKVTILEKVKNKKYFCTYVRHSLINKLTWEQERINQLG
jgi:hypothetical protein